MSPTQAGLPALITRRRSRSCTCGDRDPVAPNGRRRSKISSRRCASISTIDSQSGLAASTRCSRGSRTPPSSRVSKIDGAATARRAPRDRAAGCVSASVMTTLAAPERRGLDPLALGSAADRTRCRRPQTRRLAAWLRHPSATSERRKNLMTLVISAPCCSCPPRHRRASSPGC